MANENKETVILDFQIEQGDAISELERTKKIILDLKKEQENLNKAYKAGTITQEEYVSELVRVESVMKKTQATYNTTQKSVTGVKTKMDDLIKSNKDLNKSFEQGLNNATVFGTNLGGLKASVVALTNPVTLVTAGVTALGAAYARSTIGAKDLEFASNQLSAAITLITNEFASLVSSSEDGQGLFTKILNSFLSFSPALAASSKAVALAQASIGDQQRDEIILRQQINERLAENQELMSKVQDSQSGINDKLHNTTQIITNLRTNESELLKVKEGQLKSLQTQLDGDSKNGELQDRVAIKTGEISALKKDIERQVQSIIRLESNLLDTERKKTEELKKQREETDKKIKAQDEADARELRNREVSFSDDPFKSDTGDFVQDQFEKDKEIIDAELGLIRTSEDEKRAELLRTNALEDELHKANKKRFEQNAQLMEDNFNTLAGLFSQGSEARKIFALAGIGVDTAEAIAHLTEKSEDNPFNPATFGGAGIAQFAAGLIRIFANMAAAKQFLGGNFAGGGDFITTKPTMLLVGDNPGNRERVTVEPLSGRGKTNYNPRSGLVSFAGGGSMTFDGNKDLAVASVQQNIALRNSWKNMPRPVVGVKQFVREWEAVEVKQDVSTL